jgi:acyl-CoA thioester hydrolase
MKVPVIQTQIQLRFTDLDRMQHVSNTAFTDIFEIGKQALFAEMCGGFFDCVVVDLHVQYLSELNFTDDVVLQTYCSAIGNKSLTCEQRLFANGAVCAKARTVFVCFDVKERRSISFPAHWESSDMSQVKDI